MKNVGCKFAVNQTVENALDVFLMEIAALNAHFEPPVQKKNPRHLEIIKGRR